ncbi:tyrosine-type recombinase/integrase [Streptacidiphilus albus]|uniref:tyrosine-type recombinase/integrase n=1 Tax=Streptacidiphilus albus TaxID=105425 RepID=UPI00054BAAB7|nr:site-specific integrase [Streptacidiphilus albus]
MSEAREGSGEVAALVVPPVGAVVETADPWEPYQLLDASGAAVGPVAEYLKDLQAIGRPATTQRSYALALLRWFRFLWAVEVPWQQATRVEARDFSRWLQVAEKPKRDGAIPRGRVNPVTGKSGPGRQYAPRTRAHSETVLRSFYAFHLEMGSGPLVNPFPLVRGRDGERAGAHRTPTAPVRFDRSGLYRPKISQQAPRRIPDDRFDELFSRLPSHRDRALVALWVSTGARASELLGVRGGEVDPGQQLVTVVRKGSRALQALPTSPDALVWLRLYQAQMDGLIETGVDAPLWWTLRRPFRPLSYPAAYRMFQRVNAMIGANWSLHDLRHTAAYRMARDPGMPLTDVQWVLGHAQLTTTQLYLSPVPEDVIASVLAHHRRAADRAAAPPAPTAPGYRSESLDVLFGRGPA